MRKDEIRKLSKCRACGKSNFSNAFSLGKSPLANSFLKKSDLKKKEKFFPLTLKVCKYCSLLQLEDIVNPDLMFKNYLYVSSTSQSFRTHFEEFATDVYKTYKLKKGDLVIDIGSNDGILLKPFKRLGLKTLGVDPARNVAKIAKKNGIDTMVAYFDQQAAKKIVKKYGKAKIITAANVFAHTDDWDSLVKGVNSLLRDDGVFIIEAPHLLELIEKNLFDTIYHEHLSYLGIKPLVNFFRKHDMKIFDVKKVSSHGGSIRVFVMKKFGPYKVKTSVQKVLDQEKRHKLYSFATYKRFSKKIENNKEDLSKLLRSLKSKRKRIIGFGAPAKGNTLLNFFGIGPELIEYIVDDNTLKQDSYTPGTKVPIVSPKKLDEGKVDFILILAWNFAENIIKKYSFMRRGGTKFIIPVPTPKIIH